MALQVIMDVRRGEQQLLQGHRNNVNCLARSHNGSYLASGCVGPDQHAVFVWSVISGKPVVRLASPHGSHGVEAVAWVAADRWLVTVGGAGAGQTAKLWDWRDGPESPLASTPLRAGKVHTQVSVHPCKPEQFLVSSKTALTFLTFDTVTSELASHNPGSVEKEFGKSCGHLTQSVFLRGSRQVLSGTTRGNLVVWLAGGEPGLPRWRPARLLRLQVSGQQGLARHSYTKHPHLPPTFQNSQPRNAQTSKYTTNNITELPS